MSMRTDPITKLSFMLLAAGALFGSANDLWAADIFKGKSVYERHCQNCHGPDGRGVMAAAGDFTRGQGLMRTDTELHKSISTGKGTHPAYQGILKNTEILDVIAYIRTFQR